MGSSCECRLFENIPEFVKIEKKKMKRTANKKVRISSVSSSSENVWVSMRMSIIAFPVRKYFIITIIDGKTLLGVKYKYFN